MKQLLVVKSIQTDLIFADSKAYSFFICTLFRCKSLKLEKQEFKIEKKILGMAAFQLSYSLKFALIL